MSSKSSALALEECELSHEECRSETEASRLNFVERALYERSIHFSLSHQAANVLTVTGRITVSF